MASDSDHNLANLQPRTGKVIMYPDGSTTFIEWASDSDSDEDEGDDEDDDSYEEDKASSSSPAPVSPACPTEDTAATTCQSNCCMRRLDNSLLWVSDSEGTSDDDENKDEKDNDTDRREITLSAQARCQQIISCTDRFCAVMI